MAGMSLFEGLSHAPSSVGSSMSLATNPDRYDDSSRDLYKTVYEVLSGADVRRLADDLENVVSACVKLARDQRIGAVRDACRKLSEGVLESKVLRHILSNQ